ncbi:endocuticle structural glycoprotein SgAbd-1-like [Microplitis mediator]|uniref:endocuticle structural glycoprotein SgAbd-1-like n=1 Tax=Microplitis mediator TaxID=375433 RepID=UPI0025523DC6|nr:endocuticle structural glycoprotein SgAbd-1-like [Microplitis mediator]
MYSKALIVLAIVAAALAAPQYQSESTPIPILNESRDGPNPDGSYSWSYETANGIQAREQGSVVQSDKNENGALSVSGGYKYIGEDGNPIEVTYTADENGYQAQGAHLPVAPPIPEAILRALEWIAAHPEEDKL